MSQCVELTLNLPLTGSPLPLGPLPVPQDFAYLPENSVLRALGDFLSQAGKKGLETFGIYVQHEPAQRDVQCGGRG